MKRLFPLLFFLLLTLRLLGSDPSSIKIASWNVENLFDTRLQGTEYEEYIPGRHGWGEAMLRKKLLNLSEVICDLDADVIALQEVENDGILARLQQTLGRVGCPYRYRAITTGAGRPVHVALLSRIKIGEKREISVTRYGRERRILEITLATEPPLKLFVNHWRSKRGPESERVRYAKALRRRLERLPAGTEYLLLGDFNSDYQEYRVIDRRHNDTGGITGINQILKTIDNQGRLIRFATLGQGKGVRHLNLWMELESTRRWSHNFYGDKEAIDAILIPPSLADGKGWEYRPGSFGVYRPRYLFGSHGEIRRWAYRHGKHLGRGYSDHLPIYATFDRVSGREPSARAKKKDMLKPVPVVTISELLKRQSLKSPVRLKGVTLVARWGRHGILQAGRRGASILLYGTARELEEGRSYDLTVYGFKRYAGMPEITDLEVEHSGKKQDILPFLPPFDPRMMDEDRWLYHVVREIHGRYYRGKILVDGTAIAIHFKKRARRPKEGELLRIKRAQIGYYKDHKELVVWDRSDYQIVRK
ncbi:endonuclease/exonuclease/phosphatase family protein [Nitratifractor sp.]